MSPSLQFREPAFIVPDEARPVRLDHVETVLAERVESFNAAIPGTREARELLDEIQALRRTWRQGGGNP